MIANKLWVFGTIVWLVNAIGWSAIGSLTGVIPAHCTSLACAALAVYCLIRVE